MDRSLQAALEKAVQACIEGDQKGGLPLPAWGASFTAVGHYLPEKEHPFLREYSKLIDKGLSTTRSGNLDAADQLFSSASTLLETATLSPEGYLLAQAVYEAALAYLDYRHNDFDTAMFRLNAALTIDAQLEEKRKEFASLHLHRLQLLLNEIHLDVRRNHIEEAMTMSFHLLNYLEGKARTLPVPSSWDSAKLSLFPQEMVAVLFEGITAEIASMVAGCKTLLIGNQVFEVCNLFEGAATHTRAGNNEDCHLSPIAHIWLQMKQAFLDDDCPEFLSRAAELLSQGRGYQPSLWYTTLVELFVFCRQWDLPEACMFKNFVEKVPHRERRYVPQIPKIDF